MPTVKIVSIDEISNSIIAKIWDSSLNKSIDDYPAIAVDLSRIDLDGDITSQLANLLLGQLNYQKNLEINIEDHHYKKLESMIGLELSPTKDEGLDILTDPTNPNSQEQLKENW